MRPPARAVRRLVVLVVVLLIGAAGGHGGPDGRAGVLSLAGPAPASAAPGKTRTEYFAGLLRKDPVYVSPSLRRAVSAQDEARLRRAVAGMPYPTFVVVAPKFTDETDLETFSDLAGLLHDRLGRDGLYVVADESGIYLEAEAFGVRTRGDVDRISSIVLDAVPTRDGPIAKVLVALDTLRTGTAPSTSRTDEDAADDARFTRIVIATTLLTLAIVLGVAAMTPGARRRRADRRRERRAAREARAAAERAVVPEPDRGDARRDAQDAVAGLARAIAEAPAPPARALRSYDAASHVLGAEKARAVDYLGARALADAGQAQLHGAATWRPCLFDPRHGEGSSPTRWRRDGQDATIPACAACAALITADQAPPVLQDRGRPYWDRDTVWARTGFGALEDDVADVVLAGGRTVR